MRFARLVAFLIPLATAPAQTGRSLSISVAPSIGATSTFTARHPAAAAGRGGFLLLTLPQLTHYPLSLAGFSSLGLVRVDLDNQILTSFWVLDGTGTHAIGVAIPNDSAFQGFSFDAQTVDVDFSSNNLAWADNDLELTIGQGLIGPSLNLTRISAGTFSMGSPVVPLNTTPYSNQAQSQPVHTVTLTQPFWIGRFEVTQAQYTAIMGINPSAFAGSQRPVENVSWSSAVLYCMGLTAVEGSAGRIPPGYEYRLPTEAEWEYCCRAGTSTEYWCGPTLACAQANFGFNVHTGLSCTIGQPTQVGSYPPNGWGLHDMAGNVAEWCLDAWDGVAGYSAAAATDPYIRVGQARIYRGGSWFFPSTQCRSAYRQGSIPSGFHYSIGFRIVLAPVRAL